MTGYGIHGLSSRHGHVLRFVWHFSSNLASSDKHRIFAFPFVCGKGHRPGLGFDEGLYTGTSRALHLTALIDHHVYRSGAQKSNFVFGDSGWTAYNRYHITFFFYKYDLTSIA